MKKLFTILLLTIHYTAHILSHPAEYFKKLSEDTFQVCQEKESNEECTLPFSIQTIRELTENTFNVQRAWNELEIACLKKDETRKQELTKLYIKSQILNHTIARKTFTFKVQTTPITEKSKDSILSNDEAAKLVQILSNIISYLPHQLQNTSTQNLPSFLMDKPADLQTFINSLHNSETIKHFFHLFSEAEQREILEILESRQQEFSQTQEPVQ